MKNSFLGIALSILLFSCGKKEAAESHENKAVREKNIVVPVFNKDTAYQFIQRQVEFGPRVPNSEAHQKTADFLINTLKRFGAAVQVQEFKQKAFDGTVLSLKNIIASYNLQASKRILLAAHWDTRPFADKDASNKDKPIDGANDGASGVAILLEFARLFHLQAPEVGVDIILFDGEDYGEQRIISGKAKGTIFICALARNTGQRIYIRRNTVLTTAFCWTW